MIVEEALSPRNLTPEESPPPVLGYQGNRPSHFEETAEQSGALRFLAAKFNLLVSSSVII